MTITQSPPTRTRSPSIARLQPRRPAHLGALLDRDRRDAGVAVQVGAQRPDGAAGRRGPRGDRALGEERARPAAAVVLRRPPCRRTMPPRSAISAASGSGPGAGAQQRVAVDQRHDQLRNAGRRPTAAQFGVKVAHRQAAERRHSLRSTSARGTAPAPAASPRARRALGAQLDLDRLQARRRLLDVASRCARPRAWATATAAPSDG